MWLDQNYSSKKFENKFGKQVFHKISRNGFFEQTISEKDNSSAVTVTFGDQSKQNGDISSIKIQQQDHEESFKSLLDTSEILNVNLYSLTNNTWIEQAFDINPSEDKKELNTSCSAQAASEVFGDKLQEELISQILPQDEAGGQSKQQKATIDSYKKNSLLNQFSLTNVFGAKLVEQKNVLHQSILRFKALTSIIEKHIKNDSNAFHKLIKLFETYFFETYSAVLGSLQNNQPGISNINNYVKKAIIDLQEFIQILYKGISFFYSLESLNTGRLLDGGNLFSKENMVGFITSIVLTEKTYELVFGLLEQQNLLLEIIYRKNIKICCDKKPQDFFISDAFCLNKRTINCLKKQGLLPEGFIISEDIKLNYLNKAIDLENPYQNAILALKKLQTTKSPLQKLKTILKVMEMISNDVQAFYNKLGVHDFNKLDVNQTLLVCTYIVSRSDIANLKVHCDIIKKFSPSSALASISGFYASTLNKCVNNLCEMDFDQSILHSSMSTDSL